MKSSYKLTAVIACLVFLVLLASLIARPAAGPAVASVERPETVTVGLATRGSLTEEVVVTGDVEATAEVALAPKVSGRLARLAVGKGDRIEKGQVVAELDTETFEAEVSAAQASAKVASADIARAKATHENALSEFAREESLFKQGTSPEARMERARAVLAVAAAGVEVAEATLAQAESALELARIQAREATLVSPFAAVVADTLLDPGAIVQPGQAVVRLAAIDEVKISAAASERYLADLEPGRTPVSISVDAVPDRAFPGTLSLVSPTLDPETRTAGLEIRIPNPGHALKPGMYASVTLVTKEKSDVVLMPRDALIGRKGAYRAYVIRERHVKRTPLEVGLCGPASVEVLGGIEPGDAVVTSGEGNLYDGAQISVDGEAPAQDFAPGGEGAVK